MLRKLRRREAQADAVRETRKLLRWLLWCTLALFGVAAPTGISVGYQSLAESIQQTSEVYHQILALQRQVIEVHSRDTSMDIALSLGTLSTRVAILAERYDVLTREYARERHYGVGRIAGWMFHAPWELPSVPRTP